MNEEKKRSLNDERKYVRPFVTAVCTCALVGFYVLKTVGYEIPPEVNSLWAPVLWWFKDRHDMHQQEQGSE